MQQPEWLSEFKALGGLLGIGVSIYILKAHPENLLFGIGFLILGIAVSNDGLNGIQEQIKNVPKKRREPE